MSKLKDILSRILNMSPDSITDATGPENAESWDSFNSLLIATELEKEFKVKFSLEDIVSVKSVGDIKKILIKHEIDLEYE